MALLAQDNSKSWHAGNIWTYVLVFSTSKSPKSFRFTYSDIWSQKWSACGKLEIEFSNYSKKQCVYCYLFIFFKFFSNSHFIYCMYSYGAIFFILSLWRWTQFSSMCEMFHGRWILSRTIVGET